MMGVARVVFVGVVGVTLSFSCATVLPVSGAFPFSTALIFSGEPTLTLFFTSPDKSLPDLRMTGGATFFADDPGRFNGSNCCFCFGDAFGDVFVGVERAIL